jgi:hypothetical protein
VTIVEVNRIQIQAFEIDDAGRAVLPSDSTLSASKKPNVLREEPLSGVGIAPTMGASVAAAPDPPAPVKVEAEPIDAAAVEAAEAAAELAATTAYLVELRKTHFCRPQLDLRPEAFPADLWGYVLDDVKPTVGPAWSKWLAAAVSGRFDEIDISSENEARKLEEPYLRA